MVQVVGEIFNYHLQPAVQEILRQLVQHKVLLEIQVVLHLVRVPIGVQDQVVEQPLQEVHILEEQVVKDLM